LAVGRLTVQELFRTILRARSGLGLVQSAWLAASVLGQGQYSSAAALAETVLRNQNVPPASRIPALVVAGNVALRRGDGRADAYLDQARNLAAATGKVGRLLPAALARAEAAWTLGDREPAAHELDLLDHSDRAR
jgi:hypothetical protein